MILNKGTDMDADEITRMVGKSQHRRRRRRHHRRPWQAGPNMLEIEITSEMLTAGLDAFKRNTKPDAMADDMFVPQRIRIVTAIFQAMLAAAKAA